MLHAVVDKLRHVLADRSLESTHPSLSDDALMDERDELDTRIETLEAEMKAGYETVAEHLEAVNTCDSSSEIRPRAMISTTLAKLKAKEYQLVRANTRKDGCEELLQLEGPEERKAFINTVRDKAGPPPYQDPIEPDVWDEHSLSGSRDGVTAVIDDTGEADELFEHAGIEWRPESTE